MKKPEEKKKRRKLKIGALIVLILLLYLIGTVAYYVITSTIDEITVTGNVYLNDNEIIELAGLADNPNNLSNSSKKIKNLLEESSIIKEVEVSKSIFGKIDIKIVENKVLFYNKYYNLLVFENGETMEYNNGFLGVPTLINQVPEEIYQDLIVRMGNIDQNLILKISEIEYNPNRKEDVMLDEERFILRMNDTNTVHVNLVNFSKFANYDKIMEIQSERGTLYLDSSNSGHIFDIYESGDINEEDITS